LPTSSGAITRNLPNTSNCNVASLTDSVGAQLAQARQARGLALADVAQQLKYAPRQLEALEQDKFDRLPGPTIARGMVRNYARLLKLEPEPLLERLGERLQPTDASQLAARFSQPVPFSDSARRSTTLYVGLSLAVLALVGAVIYEWRSEQATLEFVAPVARRPAPVPAQTASLAPTPPVIAEKPGAAEAPAPPPAEEKPAVETKSVAAAGDARIVLKCERESWIEVKDAAGRVLVSALNPAGSERVVEGRPPFALIIGNAQHVKVSYNDEPVDLQPHIKVEVARFSLK
jgi:cytoskeleton protein RodZ